MRRTIAIALAWLLSGALALAQVSRPQHFLSAASTNSTLVVAGYHQIDSLLVVNTTGTIYYLKFYDKATAPTCGTDPVAVSIPIPFGTSNSGGGVMAPFPSSSAFQSGIGFCLVGGIADNDSSNAATGVVVNIWVK